MILIDKSKIMIKNGSKIYFLRVFIFGFKSNR